MKTQPTHMPTPQIVESRYFGIPQYVITYKTKEQAENHLRAVNAHEELRNCLIAVAGQIKEFCKVHEHNYFPGTLKNIEQAIAKAEGRHE